MNVRELLQDMYATLGYQSAPALEVQQRLLGSLNKTHRMILREPSLSMLRDTLAPITFASVASQNAYGIPPSISRISSLTDRTTNRLLTPMSLGNLRENDPGLTASGTPWAWVALGRGPLKFRPAATGLWAASSSASDTTATVQIAGVRTGGLLSGDISTLLTGTSRVALGTFTDYEDVISVSLSQTAVGLVTLYDAATSGNTLAQIAIGQLAPEYLRIQLYPTPTAVVTYYVDGQIVIPDLSDGQDIPLLPEDFHDVLAIGALIDEYQRKGDAERVKTFSQDFDRGLNRLKHQIATTRDDVPVMGQHVRRRFSRFGAWTPADS